MIHIHTKMFTIIINVVEMILLIFIYASSFENIQTLVNTVSLMANIYQKQTKCLHQHLASINSVALSHSSLYQQVSLGRKIESFRKKHVHLINTIRQLDRLMSFPYSSAVTTEIAFTLYMFNFIIFESNTILAKSILGLLISVQIVGAVLASFPLILLAIELTHFSTHLPSLQLQLTHGSGLALTKWKLGMYYELIHNDFKLVKFIVFPLGSTVSFGVIVKVCNSTNIVIFSINDFLSYFISSF